MATVEMVDEVFLPKKNTLRQFNIVVRRQKINLLSLPLAALERFCERCNEFERRYFCPKKSKWAAPKKAC